MKKMIMFDFDGVLVDTLGIAHSIDSEHNENLSLEEFKSFFAGNIHKATRPDGTKIKGPSNYHEIYIERTREVIVPEELKKLVAALANNYNMVIISSGRSSGIKGILEREGIYQYFGDILGNDIDKSKVVKIKMILEKYELTPADAVFVTDTVGDVIEGRECGVRSIAVTWGFHEDKTLQKANPDQIVHTPEELAKAVAEILC